MFYQLVYYLPSASAFYFLFLCHQSISTDNLCDTHYNFSFVLASNNFHLQLLQSPIPSSLYLNIIITNFWTTSKILIANTPHIFTLKYELFKNSNSPCYLISPAMTLPTETSNFLLISLLEVTNIHNPHSKYVTTEA